MDKNPHKLEQKFLSQITDDLKRNRLPLPMLPEIAMKVRNVVESADASNREMAKVINADAAVSVRLMQVANSPLYRGRQPFDTVQGAITRLGIKLVRSLVSALVMEQLYQSGANELARRHLESLWSHNVTVAAISNVLARRYTKLSPEEAMLGGLIHDIGVLPIFAYAEEEPELLENDELLFGVIKKMHAQVGKSILLAWRFSPELVACAAEHEQLDRNHAPQADYCDIVLLANLHSYLGTRHVLTELDWSDIPAFTKLGLDPATSVAAVTEARKEVTAIENLLKG
ncbi:MAG: putative signal transduction protein [Gammaproteobacteria bacterium]|nr:MAG: putative signal transduction protein [Gammaproteobacteria bacterium]TND06938.1 MAG: putative signal transduction protein [Gammaproteobacteria bacterium]